MDERHVGGLWCHEVLGLLDDFVEGTLAAERLQAVTAHTKQCQECARFGAAYGRLVKALRTSPEAALDEAGLQRLQAHLAREA